MRKSSRGTRRHASLVAALAAVATTVVVAVSAGAPAAGGDQVTTSRPDPVSASITDPGTTQSPPKVTFCFDQTVNQIVGDPTNDFFLQGPDAGDGLNPEPPNPAVVDPNNQNCVQLQFGSDPPNGGGGAVYPRALSLYTIACVLTDSVNGAPVGTPPRLNTPGCVALDGSTVTPGQGKKTGPNLVSTSVDSVNNRITYTFDRRLESFYCPAGTVGGCSAAFGYYDSTGSGGGGGVHSGDSILANDGGDSIVVQFSGGDNVADAVRFFAVDDAVQSRTQPEQNDTEHLGGPTTVPDLTEVVQVAANTFELTYDRPINLLGAGAIRAYSVDGTAYPGTSFSRPSDIRKVRVSFAGIQGFNDKVVRVVDTACGVFDLENNACSTLAAIGVRAFNQSPGFTDAPDLRQVIPEPAGNTVRFRYDQVVSSDPTVVPNIVDFALIDNNGNLSAPVGGSTASIEGTDVVVQFTGAQLAGAVGAGSDFCAVWDFEEKSGADADCSPLSVLGFDAPSPLPSGGTSSTGGSSGAGTTTGTSTTGGTGSTGTGGPGSTGTGGTTTTGSASTGPGTTGAGTTGPGTVTGGPSATTSAVPASTTTATTTTTSTTSVVAPRSSTSTRARASCRRSSRGVGCTVSGSVARRGAAARRAFGAQATCSGRVSVQVKVGRRTVSNRRVRLRSNCRYRSSVRIANRRVRGSRVRIVIRFNGNSRLAPSRRTLSVSVR